MSNLKNISVLFCKKIGDIWKIVVKFQKILQHFSRNLNKKIQKFFSKFSLIFTTFLLSFVRMSNVLHTFLQSRLSLSDKIHTK